MNIEFINYFYAGRIYQHYLDNKEALVKGLIKEIAFLVPKKDGVNIVRIKNLIKKLTNEDNITIKCSALPKKNGWRFVVLINNKQKDFKRVEMSSNYNFEIGM